MLHRIIETVDTAARAVGKIARAADTAGGVFATMIAQPETVISVGEPQALDGDDAVAFAARLAQVEAERDAVRKIGDLAVSEANILRALVKDLEHQLAEAKREEKEARDLAVDAERNAKKAEGERDAAIARAEKAEATLSRVSVALSANPFVPVEDVARLVVADRDALRARAEKAEAKHSEAEGQIRAATGEDPSDDALVRTHDAAQNAALKAIVAPLGARLFEARIAGHRALYNLGRDAARGEVARTREEVARLESVVDEERRIVTMNADALTAIDEAFGRKFSSHEDTVSAVRAVIARAEKAEAEVEDLAGLVRELNPRAEKAEADRAALEDLYNQSRDRSDDLAAKLEEIVAERDRESAALAELEKTADSIVGFAEAEVGRRMPPAEAWADIATKFRTLKKIAMESTQRYAITYEIAENALTIGLGECERLRARGAGGSSELEWQVKELRELLDESSAFCAKRSSERDIARDIADLHRALAEDALRMGLAECETLRARVAELEASPKGQPVASDDELCTIGERAFMGAYAGSTVARYAAYKAVARHVRAERPACLVARAVGSVYSVRIVHSLGTSRRWNIHVWPIGESEMKEFGVPSSEVPAMLSRMLNLVEARKAVTK